MTAEQAMESLASTRVTGTPSQAVTLLATLQALRIPTLPTDFPQPNPPTDLPPTALQDQQAMAWYLHNQRIRFYRAARFAHHLFLCNGIMSCVLMVVLVFQEVTAFQDTAGRGMYIPLLLLTSMTAALPLIVIRFYLLMRFQSALRESLTDWATSRPGQLERGIPHLRMPALQLSYYEWAVFIIAAVPIFFASFVPLLIAIDHPSAITLTVATLTIIVGLAITATLVITPFKWNKKLARDLCLVFALSGTYPLSLSA